jgi:hypothetical protein
VITMFKPGELISRYSKKSSVKGHCVVVDKDEDNYTLYNNSLKCLQRVACTVVDRLYIKVMDNNEEEIVYEMT